MLKYVYLIILSALITTAFSAYSASYSKPHRRCPRVDASQRIETEKFGATYTAKCVPSSGWDGNWTGGNPKAPECHP